MAFEPPDGNQTIMVNSDSVLRNPQNIFASDRGIVQMGWHYNFIDTSGIGSASTWTSKQSVLVVYLSNEFVLKSADSGVENPDFVSGFEVGDVVSFVDDNHAVDSFTITAISGNKITIKGGENENFYDKINSATNGWVDVGTVEITNNDYSLYCTSKPTVGNSIMVSGVIMGGYNSVLSSISLIWGQGNVVKGDKTITLGFGLNNPNYQGFVLGKYNDTFDYGDALVVGIGSSDTNRANGLVISEDGSNSYLKTTKDNFRFNKPLLVDGITASKALVSDSSGKISSSSITSAEVGYLSGATSNLQGQIDTLSSALSSVANSMANKDASNIESNNITSWKEKLEIDVLEAEIDAKATKATTLAGYGITDAKIASGVITLGANTITPLTADSTIDASKVSGAVSAATKATQDGSGNVITTTYAKASDLTSVNTEVELINLLKQNGGQLYLNGGYATTNCKPTFGAAQSLLFTYEVSETELDSSAWCIIGNLHIWSSQKGFGFAKNTSNKIQCGFNWSGNTTGRAFIEANTTAFADGKPHAWALICGKDDTSGFFKLYCDGVLIGSKTSLALFNDFIPTYGFYFGKSQVSDAQDSSAKGRLSRVAFFNFDVSAPDALYSLADYQTGKSIPPSLLNATEGNRAVLNLENYTIARNTTTRLIKDLSAGGYDATVSGEIRGDMDRRVEVFVDELKTQIAQSTATTTE